MSSPQELEEAERWSTFFSRSLDYWKAEHAGAESDLNVWKQYYVDRVLDKGYYQDVIKQQGLSLAVLQDSGTGIPNYGS